MEEVTRALLVIEGKISNIEGFLKLKDDIRGGELLSQAAYFMKSVPDEIRVLEDREVSGIKYTQKRDVLRFSVNMLKLYFEAMGGRDDLVKKAEELITRVKKL